MEICAHFSPETLWSKLTPIQDHYREILKQRGILFSTREDVEKLEEMLHTKSKARK
jgi:hypothetical protein